MSQPTDTSSLLVPIALDAWVVDSQTQQGLAWYKANYQDLASFKSPISEPFSSSGLLDTDPVEQITGKPAPGVHLHWALPDALTRGRQQPDGSFEFPLVPNRWLVVRCEAARNQWGMRAWVVQSDYLVQTDKINNKLGTSAYLDPSRPSGVSNDGTAVVVNDAQLGTSYTIEAWETIAEAGTDNYFLQAVGPGNISFAAFKPFSEDVFSFVDKAANLPPEGTGLFHYTYLVVGWYSATRPVDPLAGVATYVPGLWESETDWKAQTPAQRLNTILDSLGWQVRGELPAAAPATSLYHGLVADVTWPYGTQGSSHVANVQVAVGNTAPDALSALIQNYAVQQSVRDPDPAHDWAAAGNTLSELMQAAMFELLDDYGKPGGTALVRQQVEQSWYSSDPGGTVWQAVPVTAQNTDFDVADSRLTPAQRQALYQQLAALTIAQQAYDETQRTLQAQQGELYRLWLKLSQAQNFGWGDAPEMTPDFESVVLPLLQTKLYPGLAQQVWELCQAQAKAQAQLPDPTDARQATAWADAHWRFPTATAATATLTELGLELKASTAARFWHPSDPVLLICGSNRARKHGEDGRFNPDATLTCRLPGQTITGLRVGSQPEVSAQALGAKVTFNALSRFLRVPAVTNLLTEAFFSEPLNASLIASLAGGDPKVLESAISGLLTDSSGPDAWVGTPPSPLAYGPWQQAWSPLFLEWMVNYYPTVADAKGHFEPSAWRFDGTDYTWTGQEQHLKYALNFKGRAVVTPYAQNVFQNKLRKYLTDHPGIKNAQLEALLEEVMSWDILAQRLSGLTDQLLTLRSQETFPPPAASTALTCPNPADGTIDIGALVQDEYHLMPVLEGDGNVHNFFFPIRGGVVTFPDQRLQVVDAFGQTYDLTKVNTGQGFQPLISPSLLPPAGTTLHNLTPFVLGPRLVQSARLDLTLLANDGGGRDVRTTPNNNPICGWLLPNHLDNSLAVYDAAGTPLGELWLLPPGNSWRPRPGPPGPTPPPRTPADIANPTLRRVVSTLAEQTAAVLTDFLHVVDETLWTVDPLGGRADAFLSTLIGRPLAVVQVEATLTLNGPAATNQFWRSMVTPDSTLEHYQPIHDTGGVEDVPFPVRLGSLDLRNDGLLGYFRTEGSGSYSTFYTVHPVPKVGNGANFIKPILRPVGPGPIFQGDVYLQPDGPGTILTMLLDPRGVVHGYTGILPVQTVALPAHLVEEFLRTLLVTFQTGPILADPGPIRTPQPAEKQGTWSWLQHVGPTWEQTDIVDTTDAARFPPQPPTLREGWLQLSGLEEEG